MKNGFAINISEVDNYEEEILYMYHYFIGKLIYLTYNTRPCITFTIGQLSKYNADPQKSYL